MWNNSENLLRKDIKGQIYKYNMKKEIRNKKSQLAIFVIIAILIVALVAIIFAFNSEKIKQIFSSSDTSEKIKMCSEQALKEAETNILVEGGLINDNNKRLASGNNISYLCYTSENRKICTNTHPALKGEIEKEIMTSIRPKIEKCLDNIEGASNNKANITLNIEPGILNLNINKKITLTKDDQTIVLENFNSQINSPLFEFIMLSNEIINQEVLCECGIESCGVDTLELSKRNPNFKISAPVYDDNGRVYIIRELNTGKEFNFAVRNCILNV